MKGKWAAGIEPRNFTWVFRDKLAVSERPGGSTMVHRKVRRDEELLWLKHSGITRIVSVLPPAAVETSDSVGISNANYPLTIGGDMPLVLAQCYQDLADSLERGDVTLLHGDEVSDRLLGVVIGYLMWSGRVTSLPMAISSVERLFRRSLGPEGRVIVQELPVRGDH